VTGSLQASWIHGAPDCAASTASLIQVHPSDTDAYILRQSKCSEPGKAERPGHSFEAPFMYLLLREARGLLMDTGASRSPLLIPLAVAIHRLLVASAAATSGDPVPRPRRPRARRAAGAGTRAIAPDLLRSRHAVAAHRRHGQYWLACRQLLDGIPENHLTSPSVRQLAPDLGRARRARRDEVRARSLVWVRRPLSARRAPAAAQVGSDRRDRRNACRYWCSPEDGPARSLHHASRRFAAASPVSPTGAARFRIDYLAAGSCQRSRQPRASAPCASRLSTRSARFDGPQVREPVRPRTSEPTLGLIAIDLTLPRTSSDLTIGASR
jgi:hypothetical protein